VEQTDKEKGNQGRLITEAELLKVLGLKKPELDKLRTEKDCPMLGFQQGAGLFSF